MRKLALENNINMNNIAFMGNDINDKECLDEVGLPIVVADAFSEVIKKAKYRTKKPGGYGAVREVCDMIYKIKNRG